MNAPGPWDRRKMSEHQPITEQERAELVAYLDGELRGEAARAMEAKLSLHPRMRAEAESLKRAWDMLELLPRAEPSPQFTERTLSRLALAQSPRRQPRWLQALGYAAAILATFAAGWGGYALLVPWHPGQRELVRDLRIIENFRFYEPAGDMGFLSQLAQPDLFGEEHAGS